MSQDRPVGELLREWRRRRQLSQLDLAIQAEVSSRHVSFVETGRTVPSRPMVLRLAEHLQVPLRDRNRLLVAAGYAPVYQERPLDDPDLTAAREALHQILRGHEPNPALVVDRRWNLVLANSAADVFLDGVAPALLEPPVNMMRLGLHPAGFASRLLNLGQVRGFLLPRLARQVQQTGDPQLSDLYSELVSYGAPDQMQPPDPVDIAMPIRIRHRGVELSFINTITTFGAAFDVTLEEIAIEAYFPADARTALALRSGGHSVMPDTAVSK
ncbi:helix-turn-helix domain-containing protein [Streptosporangium sp. NPDC000396]|uniref:MmyB family transcriptional regulator n=1 Tax=Streptosporangium sp. NPDC000396 TaxID=3366185 RepID=UPI0036A9DAA0